MSPSITLIGLGPGDPALLTRGAAEALAQAREVYTLVPGHPALSMLPARDLHRLPDAKAAPATLVAAAEAGGQVTCAVAGHPRDHALVRALAAWGGELRIVPGVSLVDACCDGLGLDGRAAGLQVIGAAALLECERVYHSGIAFDAAERPWVELQGLGAYVLPLTPYPLTPAQPALVLLEWGAWRQASSAPDQWSHDTSSERPNLIAALKLRYPPAHQVRLVWLDHFGQTARRWEQALADLGAPDLAEAHALWLPPLAAPDDRRGGGLAWVVARLLGPGGCPWDRQQTHQSLRTALLEEAHEVLEALDAGDMAALSEELGDLLISIVAHSEMARQAGHFDFGDVLEQVTTKLIRRHPHVFAALAVAGEGEVLRNWEQIKAQELAEKGRSRASALDGIPASLPALVTAQKLSRKARRAGFEWRNLGEAWAKLHEELNELAEAAAGADRQRVAEELGDVLACTVKLAHWLDIDAETALRETNARFRHRFSYVEQAAASRGGTLNDLSLDEMLALWREAKKMQHGA